VKINKFTFNPFFENTYIIWDEQTLSAAVIDPGMEEEYEEDEIKLFIKSNSLKIKYLVNTHCHIDHLLGVRFIKDEYNPLYIIPEKDLPLFENAPMQAGMFGVNFKKLPKPDKYLSEQENLTLGNKVIKCIFTPGHSPGEFCLYSKDGNFCITGDVLFKESIGRTDLYGGNFKQLIDSIKSKLFTLNNDVVIYPGHGEESTVGYEKLKNPFLV
jgi:glyoxylase-like metal-dependent hydrolase (beta-lactamase superfamily II)